MKVDALVTFGGRCEEALEFYKNADRRGRRAVDGARDGAETVSPS